MFESLRAGELAHDETELRSLLVRSLVFKATEIAVSDPRFLRRQAQSIRREAQSLHAIRRNAHKPESSVPAPRPFLSESTLGRLKGAHCDLLCLMLKGTTSAVDLARISDRAERTVINRLQETYRILGVHRKIDVLNLCYTDPGLKALLASMPNGLVSY
ncbi:MAG TPA: hypothetical protein VGD50_02735 [Candidatus Baltobacteraceae bacterium]